MDDNRIIQLFWKRDETAIKRISEKYSNYCYTIAWNILFNHEDSEECLNDTWLKIWGYIPPNVPKNLSVYAGKITRGLAIDRIRKKTARKRTDTHIVSLDAEVIALNQIVEKTLDDVMAEKELLSVINKFLYNLPPADRDIFIRRYWYMDTLEEIAKRHNKKISTIKSNLFRNRKKLLMILTKERGDIQ